MDEHSANKQNVESVDKTIKEPKKRSVNQGCKFCKARYVLAEATCQLCYYKNIRRKNVEIWKLREEVARLKIKLRKKK